MKSLRVTKLIGHDIWRLEEFGPPRGWFGGYRQRRWQPVMFHHYYRRDTRAEFTTRDAAFAAKEDYRRSHAPDEVTQRRVNAWEPV